VEPTVSGVGVIDKATAILVAVEKSPASLGDLVNRTGQSRPTAHRLATALEVHGLLRRTPEGRYALGPRLVTLGHVAADHWPLAEAAGDALAQLRDATGESAQLYVRHGDARICLASLESPHGLRTIVATGAVMPLDQGSGGRVLAGEESEHGWIESAAEREAGVASVSAPVVDVNGVTVAAVSVSGPIERLSSNPGSALGAAVVAAAKDVAAAAGLI
jgi:DNA-binding IclR family transcriptional regulator